MAGTMTDTPEVPPKVCPCCGQKFPRKVAPEIPDGHAYCRPCDRVLSLDAFHLDKNKPNGHASRCKECAKAKNAAYRDRTQPDRKRREGKPEDRPKAPPKDHKSVPKRLRKLGIWRGEDGWLYSSELGGMMLPPERQDRR